MREEYVTTNGKLIIENKILFIRSLRPRFSETLAFRIATAVIPPIVLIGYIITDESPKRFMGIIVWAVFSTLSIPRVIDLLFRKSFAYRIPVARVRSVSTVEDQYGLETELHLHLTNGRTRVVVFRTAEPFLTSFLEKFSTLIAQSQLT